MTMYIMDEEGEVREAKSILEWGKWFEKIENRRVAYIEVGDKIISTIFLGIDHNFSGEGPPILFETMILSRTGEDEYCERYTNIEDAMIGHEMAVLKVRLELNNFDD